MWFLIYDKTIGRNLQGNLHCSFRCRNTDFCDTIQRFVKWLKIYQHSMLDRNELTPFLLSCCIANIEISDNVNITGVLCLLIIPCTSIWFHKKNMKKMFEKSILLLFSWLEYLCMHIVETSLCCFFCITQCNIMLRVQYGSKKHFWPQSIILIKHLQKR